ncbi:MAG: histidine triad protein [Chloroflexi bacterium]|nr:histidine triad protein [Chloroflexota bacterium]
MSCLFCQIASGEISAIVVHKAEGVTAFRDIAPQASTHVLIIPDRHIDGADAMAASDEALVGKLIHVAAEIARVEGIAERGYRLVINQGRDAGQTVDHLHLHLLGGGPLHTPLV